MQTILCAIIFFKIIIIMLAQLMMNCAKWKITTQIKWCPSKCSLVQAQWIVLQHNVLIVMIKVIKDDVIRQLQKEEIAAWWESLVDFG